MSQMLMNLPRGLPELGELVLDMTPLVQAEKRLREVMFATAEKAPELMGFYNESANLVNKYLSWVEYEIIQAEKHYTLAKSVVILDKGPELFQANKNKYPDVKMTYNEDFRDALVTQDEKCQQFSDIKEQLKAAKALLRAKGEAFERSFYACKAIMDARKGTVGYPNLNGNLGELSEPQRDFMGRPELPLDIKGKL